MGQARTSDLMIEARATNHSATDPSIGLPESIFATSSEATQLRFTSMIAKYISTGPLGDHSNWLIIDKAIVSGI